MTIRKKTAKRKEAGAFAPAPFFTSEVPASRLVRPLYQNDGVEQPRKSASHIESVGMSNSHPLLPKHLYAMEFSHGIKIGASHQPAERADQISRQLEALGIIAKANKLVYTDAVGTNWREAELAALEYAEMKMKRISNREWFSGNFSDAVDAIQAQKLLIIPKNRKSDPFSPENDRISRGNALSLRHLIGEYGFNEKELEDADFVIGKLSSFMRSNFISADDFEKNGIDGLALIKRLDSSPYFSCETVLNKGKFSGVIVDATPFRMRDV